MCDKRVRRFCSVLACASECTFHHFLSLHPCLNPPLFPPSFPLSFPAFLSPSLSLTLPFKSEDQIDISQSAGGKELSRHCGHERAAQGERERQREEERERESFCESEQERVCVIVCDCVCVCVCARARVCHPLTRPTSPTHSLTNKHTQGRRGSKI